MKRLLSIVLCTAAVACAGLTHAATVHVGMIALHETGSWDVWAWTSPGDNDGIAAYNIEMENYGAGVQDVPLLFFPGPFAVGGFTVGGADIPDAQAGNSLFAGMNSSNPSSLIYGVGSPDEGGRIPTLDSNVPGQRQIPWRGGGDIDTSDTFLQLLEGTHFIVPDHAVHIASGQQGFFRHDINPDFGEININVWSAGQAAIGGTASEAASGIAIHRAVICICPEPTSYVIFGIVILGLGLIRKRL